MHRRPLRALLDRYLARYPDELATVDRFAAFVDAHPDCLLRTCRPGHVTAAAWILSPDGSRCLLTHHRKLDRWLQLGGHVDGDPDILRAALREAHEESGLEHFTVPSGEPFDVDIHAIPPHGGAPAHQHFDVRFLFRAPEGAAPSARDGARAARWVPFAEVGSVNSDASVRNAVARLRAGTSVAPRHGAHR